MITQDLGIATAYGYALSKGYEGTEEEFAELMASYATVAESAAESAEQAIESALQAGQYSNASRGYSEQARESASDASESATSADASKLDSEAYAVGKRNGTDVGSEDVAYHNNAKYYAEQASGSATSAESAKDTAVSSKDTAVAKAGEASTSAQTATNKANEASTSETNASAYKLVSEGYAVGKQNGQDVESGSPYYENNAKYYAEQAEETLEDYARIDGYYQDMSVGSAEQLISTVSIEDSVPYKFRTSGGSVDIGNRETDMIVGGTIAWNQLVLDSNRNFTSVTSDTRPFTLQLRMSGSPYTTAFVSNIGLGKGIYTRLFVGIDTQGSGLYLTHNGSNNNIEIWKNTNQQLVVGHKYLFNVNVVNNDTTTVGGLVLEDMMLFDLTQMFGSTIADYIYSLEQATAGAGVSFFRSLFPNMDAEYTYTDASDVEHTQKLRDYQTGVLLSVSGLQSHDMRGFNAWDEVASDGYIDSRNGNVVASANHICSKNFIKCLPNTQYYLLCPNASMSFDYYDADKNFISATYNARRTVFTTPSNCYYMKWWNSKANYGSQTYQHDICINLSWDGERDGEYEPYTINSYALDDSLTLRGIPKLDASNNLYYDGDTYESDGTVTRRYGVVDLGSLTWTYKTGDGDGKNTYFKTEINSMYAASSEVSYGNIISSKYRTAPDYYVRHGTVSSYNKTIGALGSQLDIADSSYSDAATFKTAMSGAYLVYQLKGSSVTTESAEPYTNPQIVDDFGTEEYVTDSIVPVGHVTQYMNNLRAKLEMAPESPSGDGDYIVRQTSGENSYVALASTTTIQSIIARLEALEGGNE